MTYLTGALYVHPFWFYKHQHENRVRSKLFVACQHLAFSLPFAAILVNSAPSGEMHNYCIPHIIKENFENFLIRRCNYILLSEVYCIWQVVKTPTIILNNPVFVSCILNKKFILKLVQYYICTPHFFFFGQTEEAVWTQLRNQNSSAECCLNSYSQILLMSMQNIFLILCVSVSSKW